MIIEQVDKDLKDAMKAKEVLAVSALRMLKSAAKNTAIEKKKDVLDDGELTKVIGKLVKQRRDSIEEFRKGGRSDLIEKEEAEIEVLARYLPKAMDESELDAIIDAVIKESGASKKSDMGSVMKVVLAKAAGRADGSAVSRKVAAKLA